MAKDDYFVVVYQILKYLYDCLKSGEAVELERFTLDGLQISNERYFNYIMLGLQEQSFITGVKNVPMVGTSVQQAKVSQTLMITPLGIEYLFENSMTERVKRTLKGVKDIVPML